jgi:hypothetical protein
MTDPRNRPDDRPDPSDTSLEDEIAALQGEEPLVDQDGALDIDDVEGARTPTLTELDGGAVTIADPAYARTVDPAIVASLDALQEDGLRDGETDDPLVAIEEGLVYIPPSDPPTVPSDDPQGIDIAAGSGVLGATEPIDDDHRSGEDLDESEINARIREAIRDDAATSPYADRIEIAVLGATAILRGTVDDLDDGDTLAAVVERVAGIAEVRDETEVASLG